MIHCTLSKGRAKILKVVTYLDIDKVNETFSITEHSTVPLSILEETKPVFRYGFFKAAEESLWICRCAFETENKIS